MSTHDTNYSNHLCVVYTGNFCYQIALEPQAAGSRCLKGVNEQKILRASIIGVPNAGKTTLVNQLLGQKVSKS